MCVCLLQQRYNVDPESLLGAGTVSLDEEEDPLINHNTVSSWLWCNVYSVVVVVC